MHVYLIKFVSVNINNMTINKLREYYSLVPTNTTMKSIITNGFMHNISTA